MPATRAVGPARRPVTRMSKHFAHMLEMCPQDIQVYSACVASITGGVNRGACEAEFEKLKQCFVRVAQHAAVHR